MSEGKEDKKPNLAGWAAILTAVAALITSVGFPDFFPDLVKRFVPESSSESTSLPNPQIAPSEEESSPVVTPPPSPSNSSVSPPPSPTATLAPVASEPLITPLEWNDTASNLSGRLDQDFTYNCPSGGRVGSLWGTDIYTVDSSICTAAVHSGLINARDGGQITIRIKPGQDTYIGMTRNGVKSSSYGSYRGSFIFLK
ncbi:MAG: LCCL domain-containing protein [Cyanobacteria bacterium P01_G01_bin.38]